MKLLDLAKFKKVKEDKDTTTMRHDDGHEMTILVAKLPKIHREQLKRLKMADGGMAHYDEGTPDEPVSNDDAKSNASDKGVTVSVAPAAPAPIQQGSIPGTMPVQPTNPAVALADSPPYTNVPSVPQTPPNVNPNTGTLNPAAAAQNAQTAVQLQGEIDAAKAKGAQGIEQNRIAQEAQSAQIDQNNLNDLKGHLASFDQYVQNNPIDPKHWAESQTSVQKGLNAIGLLAGGFSGGFSGTGNNPAMNFMNQQIDRDIQAQKDRMDQQKTIYGAYHQLYGDSVAANAMTKASMNTIYQHQFNQLAAQLGTPQAAQAAMQSASQKAIENSKLIQAAVVDLRALPGYLSPNGSPSVTSGQRAGQVSGASGSWAPGMSQEAQHTYPSDHILNPAAPAIDAGLKYDYTHTDQQKSDVHNQYLNAVEADKAIDQINQIFPKITSDATWGGYLANQVNPNAMGALGALGGAYAGAAGATALAPETAGASLSALAPAMATAGAKGAAIGEATGYAAKKALRGIGGQQESDYETDRAALRGYIGRALGGTHTTDTEMDSLADAYVPRKIDSPEVVENKRKQLIEKIRTLTNSGALRDRNMTNKQYTLP